VEQHSFQYEGSAQPRVALCQQRTQPSTRLSLGSVGPRIRTSADCCHVCPESGPKDQSDHEAIATRAALFLFSFPFQSTEDRLFLPRRVTALYIQRTLDELCDAATGFRCRVRELAQLMALRGERLPFPLRRFRAAKLPLGRLRRRVRRGSFPATGSDQSWSVDTI